MAEGIAFPVDITAQAVIEMIAIIKSINGIFAIRAPMIICIVNCFYWIRSRAGAPVDVLIPGGRAAGIGEAAMKMLKPGDMIQMERVGFGQVDKAGDTDCVGFLNK